ncbi:MAG: hypothetical protein P1U87_10590 [Verrucomicrobiales bacterium]|nr:hypothetical protein [Verrucomicrobiales bacterium]
MSEFIIQIEKLITAYSDPEYRYLLLEPLIFFGIMIGVGMLITGFFMKAPKLQMAALVTVGITALTHIPYKEARIAAQPRMEQVYKISSPSRVKGFNETTKGWIAASWKFRLLILVTLVAILVGVNRNRLGVGLGIATALIGLFAAKDAMWFHYQDALAYHPNLKQHVAPIDTKTHAPPPSRKREKSPPPVNTREVAPAAPSPTRPLSASRGSAVSTIDRSRIPPPQVPIAPRPPGPQPRYVTPIR